MSLVLNCFSPTGTIKSNRSTDIADANFKMNKKKNIFKLRKKEVEIKRAQKRIERS